MIKQILESLAEVTESSEEIIPGILLLKFTVVNACIVESTQSPDQWMLVDTGLESSGEFILKTVRERYGESAKPVFILLTHGHFDHVGSVEFLSAQWDVPVYAHPLELPYLTGEKDYPQGNPEADEGLVAKMSSHFPNRSINISGCVRALPEDGSVPEFPEWKWIQTNGHTQGHISLFREKDGVLIAGDAFTGTKQESLISVLTQKEKVKGPPAYFTEDWDAAKKSVFRIRELNPKLAILSHGQPMSGVDLRDNLNYLTEHFDSAAVPHE